MTKETTLDGYKQGNLTDYCKKPFKENNYITPGPPLKEPKGSK